MLEMHCHWLRVAVFKTSGINIIERYESFTCLYYSHITKTDGRPTVGEPKMGKSGDSGRLSADVDTDFGRFFGRPTTFFVEATKLKVSLTDPPIFRCFVIGEASGDGRPMIGRQSADFLKNFSSWYRPKVARSSGVNRPTIASRSMTFYQRTVGRRTPDIGRHSADDRPTVGRS